MQQVKENLEFWIKNYLSKLFFQFLILRDNANDGCAEGEGDCHDDNDCQGSLVCGNKNCLK